jgi:hypothetical protein
MQPVIRTGNGYTIHIEHTPGLGSIWIVRTFRKSLCFKRLISSDWFLDGTQAQRFAEQVAGELGSDTGTDHLRHRTPGWTYRQLDR